MKSFMVLYIYNNTYNHCQVSNINSILYIMSYTQITYKQSEKGNTFVLQNIKRKLAIYKTFCN